MGWGGVGGQNKYKLLIFYSFGKQKILKKKKKLDIAGTINFEHRFFFQYERL